ncbi:hypothetical protein A4G20_10760 [Pasteurellaceae bacterium RH1A]|nr:hypothetical protein A4G20_10760 [Pasteurellaceae bacterium RH1A]
MISGKNKDIFHVLHRNVNLTDEYGKHQENYIFIDEIPNQSILNKIKNIRFIRSMGDFSTHEVPEWFYKTKQVSYLSLPINFFLDEKFTQSEFLQNLTLLDITHSHDISTMIDIDCSKFINLKRLRVMAYNHRLINTDIPKNIEAFSINLEDRVKNDLSKIGFLKQVKYLQLESISTKLDLSILSELQLTGLSILYNFHKKQSLLSIIDLSELECLFINNIAMPIDFEIFKSASKLKEITIWNSKKFENIAAISLIPSLRALEIAYSKFNPTEEEKDIINNMKLDYLSIV